MLSGVAATGAGAVEAEPARTRALCARAAQVFSGQVPEYPGIGERDEVSLGCSIRRRSAHRLAGTPMPDTVFPIERLTRISSDDVMRIVTTEGSGATPAATAMSGLGDTLPGIPGPV